jgi:glycine/D-amino acid oxidase-like deaminating enzyme
MSSVIIVGAGLFGQIISRALREDGHTVLMMDRGEEMAGSKPAACLMKPSWFSGLGADVHEPALSLLDELYDLQTIQFELMPKSLSFLDGALPKASVYWVQPSTILSGDSATAATVANVTEVKPGSVVTDLGVFEADVVIVAAGVWSEELLPQYKQQAQHGLALLFPDHYCTRPAIQAWAPYRQRVGFNRGDGMWIGDGTAIKASNWNDERTKTVADRCRAMYDVEGKTARYLHGLRPYAKGHKPCLLEQPSPGVWLASGGAKNGTVAAAYCAHKIRESLR